MRSIENFMKECRLCPRNCGVNRFKGETGFCMAGSNPVVAKIMLHHWEEPVISGTRGSGAVFFSGCNLKCCFCQNHAISHQLQGIELTVSQLAEEFLNLQSEGAHNINLVTGTHFIPQIAAALRVSKAKGLRVPIVYNSNAYEKPASLALLEGLVDVYLPDLKFFIDSRGERYCQASNYFVYASQALLEMVRQRGPAQISADNLMVSGVMVRHLIMPEGTADSRKCLEWLRSNLPFPGVYLSIMAQYLPCFQAPFYPEINRTISESEYQSVLDAVFELQFEEGYIQELTSATPEYIPDFNCFKG